MRNSGGERPKAKVKKDEGIPRLLYCTDWKMRMYWMRGSRLGLISSRNCESGLVRPSTCARSRLYPVGKAPTLLESHGL